MMTQTLLSVVVTYQRIQGKRKVTLSSNGFCFYPCQKCVLLCTILHVHDSSNDSMDQPSIYEITANLALEIDHQAVSRFNMSLWHLEWSSQRFQKSNILRKKDILVKFSDNEGSFEEGLDTGGPKREFLSLLMKELNKRPIFDGPVESRYLVYNSTGFVLNILKEKKNILQPCSFFKYGN